MARKPARKKKRVTVAGGRKKPVVTDQLGKSYAELKAAAEAFSHSHIAYQIERILEAINDPYYKMEPWEVEAIGKLIEVYNVKYNNPLVKAMK